MKKFDSNRILFCFESQPCSFSCEHKEAHSPAKRKTSGLAHWMGEVPREAAEAADSFDNDAVHDARVALWR